MKPDWSIGRRRLLSLLGIGMVLPYKAARALGPGIALITALKASVTRAGGRRANLLTAPLELGGKWAGSAQPDVAAVIGRARAACLGGVALMSDRQPERLRVDDGSGRYPSVWLQTEVPTTAWIHLVVGNRDWCRLAYQFGHELGHVFCNSWEADAKPRNPCQWVEEALVEAFSLRGLGVLANDWARAPPFPNDAGYAGSIRDYLETMLAGYRATAREQGVGEGIAAWFKAHQAFLSENGGVDAARGAVSTMFDLLQGDAALVEDMGALNRWPGRSGVALPDYLDLWAKSCAELKTPGRLPVRIRELLGVT